MFVINFLILIPLLVACIFHLIFNKKNKVKFVKRYTYSLILSFLIFVFMMFAPIPTKVVIKESTLLEKMDGGNYLTVFINSNIVLFKYIEDDEPYWKKMALENVVIDECDLCQPQLIRQVGVPKNYFLYLLMYNADLSKKKIC